MTRVVVLSGGTSAEHDVSLASGADVAASLRERYDVLPVVIGREGDWSEADAHGRASGRPVLDGLGFDGLAPDDIVFPVMHGGWGEDGGVQRELEARDAAYVGCGVAASEIGMSKLGTARVAERQGVDVIPSRAVSERDFSADPAAATESALGDGDLPLIVKPNNGGSSVGVHVVHSVDELRTALAAVLELDPIALVQPLVDGAEISIGVWSGPEGALRTTGASLVHLPDGSSAFGFDDKYASTGAWIEIPATLPAGQLDASRAAALRTAAAIGVRGLARIDFFIEDGRPVLNEVNTLPGLRRESHFSRLVAAAGTDYDDLLVGLVEQARVR